MMKELEAFYKKNTDFNFSVVNKGALEMNMFSNERVTFEGMIKKAMEEGLSKEITTPSSCTSAESKHLNHHTHHHTKGIKSIPPSTKAKQSLGLPSK
jgi:hypothetical protein